ncbi:MAG: hypothetical protein ABIO88_00275 [Burkholderiaceae bacterium]
MLKSMAYVLPVAVVLYLTVLGIVIPVKTKVPETVKPPLSASTAPVNVNSPLTMVTLRPSCVTTSVPAKAAGIAKLQEFVVSFAFSKYLPANEGVVEDVVFPPPTAAPSPPPPQAAKTATEHATNKVRIWFIVILLKLKLDYVSTW